MIEVVPAKDLGESYRRRITDVFAGGFSADFTSLSKDPLKLTDAFEHMLILDLFYVGLVDGEPAGIAACTNGVQESTRHDGRELRRHLGLVKGTIADLTFRSEFSGGVPGITPGAASIEFVATSPDYRGQGVARAVLTHLLELPNYREYVIDGVADTNVAALRVYERLGFTEFRRHSVWHTRFTGINYYVSLRLVQS